VQQLSVELQNAVLVGLQTLSGSVTGGRSESDSWSENSHRADVLGLCAHKRTEQLEVLDCILRTINLMHICTVTKKSF